GGAHDARVRLDAYLGTRGFCFERGGDRLPVVCRWIKAALSAGQHQSVAVAALGNDPAGTDSTTAAACARQRRIAFIAGANSVAGSLCDSSGAGAGGLSANLFRRESDLC